MSCETFSKNKMIFLVGGLLILLSMNFVFAELNYTTGESIYGIMADGTKTGALNITFQIRSCNDSVCSGETFVGPDNTSSTYFTNATANTLNETLSQNNTYFQYKAFFHTEDQNYTSMLFNVSISYTDITLPVSVITYPANSTYAINVSDLNYTFTEINCDSVWYSLDSGATNSSREICGTNWTDLTSNEGNNIWTIYLNDTTNNANSTSISFFKDSTPPSVVIKSPEARYYYINYVDFNVSVNENVSMCKFSIDDWLTNYTMTEFNTTYYNYTLSGIAEGRYIPRVWCNDSYNNINNSEIVYEFIMDAIKQTGLSGPSSYIPLSTISNETIYDIEVAEEKSIELTKKLKEFTDKIPVKIKEAYNFIKSKIFYVGALISPQNKERGATILLVIIVISIFVMFRYNEYLEIKYDKIKDRLLGKTFSRIRKAEKSKRIKYIDSV